MNTLFLILILVLLVVVFLNNVTIHRVVKDLERCKAKGNELGDTMFNGLSKAFRKEEADIEYIQSQIRSMDERISALTLKGNELDKRSRELSHWIDANAELIRKEMSASARGHNQYSDEYKMECINFVIHEENNIRKAAEKLEIPYSNLKTWLREYRMLDK